MGLRLRDRSRALHQSESGPEQNIRSTLEAVLANQGAVFEVVVLDDHSTDSTATIVSEFVARDSRVRLEFAPPLPAGWCGKQHACHVLA